uniref:C2H2-type domain-containing protein n=1 Tax=Gadus morhua TaxID=8049 RepID=A0A8C5A9N5_GADMO
MPAVEDCDAFVDRGTQCGATSEILGVVAPGSSHWSSRCEELVQTPDTISIKLEEDIGGGLPAVEDCDAFVDRGTQCGATSEILGVIAPGSSHWSSRCEELVQTPDTISIKLEEDIGGGLPAVEDCDAFVDRGTQCGATSEILGVIAPGSSHWSSRCEELVQTPGTISIKLEEDIGGGMTTVEDNDIRDCSTQRGAISESLRVDAPGSSHMSSHSGELRILCVYGQGEGPLAVDGHDTLFAASELEALSSLSADHSVAKSLNCSVRLVRLEDLTGHQSCRKGLCGKVISNNVNMIVHMSTRIGKKPYKCDQCTKRFSLKGPLKIHMRTHSGEKPYKCDQCTKCFSHGPTLKLHMTTHTGKKPYRCDQCTKGFSLKGRLNVHMRTHSGEKPYKCDHCTKCFSLKSNLNIHMRTHSGEKAYKCDQCMKCFSQKGQLNIHMRTHTGEKPYRCEQCPKRFSQGRALKFHMSTHFGEMPYRCDQCTKSFQRKCYLKIHLRTHSGEKPYKCDQCMKCFSQKGEMNIHMRIHSEENPYRCDQCPKRFTHGRFLKYHMWTHTGEKPYRCDQCTKCFQRKCDLEIHMRTHSEEKPCVCLQCNACYSDPSSLRLHLLKAHFDTG